MTLTKLQSKFVDEYVVDGNIMQAALRAGYSERYAKSSSYKLLDNVGIQQAIAEKEKEKEAYLRQRFAFDAEKARDVMFQLMNDDNTPENVRLSAAKDFLDRAGYKPVDKQEVAHSGGVDIGDKADAIREYLESDEL